MTQQHEEKGFILTLVLVILVILTIFSVAMLMLSTINIETAGNIRADQENLNQAYTRFERAKRDLLNASCRLNDIGTNPELLEKGGADSVIDMADSVSDPPPGNSVVCEYVDASSPANIQKKLGLGTLRIKGYYNSCRREAMGNTPSSSVEKLIERDHFFIRSVSELNQVKKTIEARVEYKSFLAFSRFTASNMTFDDAPSTYYIDGDIYCGGNLTVNSKCVFQRDVYVTADAVATDEGSATFNGKVYGNYEKLISLDVNKQLDDLVAQAQDCGWIINNATGRRDALGNSKYGGLTINNLLVLDNFKNLERKTDLSARRYEGDGAAVTFPNDKFCGIIVWDSANTVDLHVQGLLGSDNKGKNLVIISRTQNIYIDSHIKTAGATFVGLIVSGNEKKIRFAQNSPNFIENHASIMVTDSSTSAMVWDGGDPSVSTYTNAAYNATSTVDLPCGTPPAPTCTFSNDLDNSGSIEDTDVYGWHEKSNLVGRTTDILLQVGSVISTKQTLPTFGGPWRFQYPVNVHNGVPNNTIIYRYDYGILINPPPFPRIKNVLRLISYTEYDGG